MINLAGDKNADKFIKEELYLAGIDAEQVGRTNSEVPYTIIGRIGKWELSRAWYYWVAKVKHVTDGLPLDDAMRLFNTENPTDDTEILGTVIRSGGSAGCNAPNDYTSQPEYNDELDEQLLALGYKKEYSELLGREYISINYGEVARLCNEGKLNVQRYVDTYHIDTQIGLTEFAKFIKTL
jgi:hypothetical protein